MEMGPIPPVLKIVIKLHYIKSYIKGTYFPHSKTRSQCAWKSKIHTQGVLTSKLTEKECPGTWGHMSLFF